jgi:Transposase DDE domain
VADSSGRAIAFRVVPGQAHELPHAVPLLDCLPGVPRWIVADRGYLLRQAATQRNETLDPYPQD